MALRTGWVGAVYLQPHDVHLEAMLFGLAGPTFFAIMGSLQ